MTIKPAVSHEDHIQGNPQAVIELVEYGDFQCPFCGQAYPVVKALQEKFGNELKFVFRNFPLSKIHPQAKMAAIAAEAAAIQGKFWEMHDLLFENQKNLTASALMRYAQQAGLDVELFEADLKSEALRIRVEADFESGMRSGVHNMPAFFINGEKYTGKGDEAHLSEYIQNKIDLLAGNQSVV